MYCLGFRQKDYHASATYSAEEAPSLNSTYCCREGGEDCLVIFYGWFCSAASVGILVSYNAMRIVANVILHGWNTDIMVHFYNCEYLSYKRESRKESYTRSLWPRWASYFSVLKFYQPVTPSPSFKSYYLIEAFCFTWHCTRIVVEKTVEFSLRS